MNSRSDAARERLRAEHRVRLVQAHEEGTAAHDLPAGVYGFTGSPGLAAPLFAVRRYRNFEVHHLPDDGVAIIGFVSAQTAARLSQASDPLDVTIYPDVEGEATEIVAVRYAEIAQHRQYSVRNAPGMSLRIIQVPVATGHVPDTYESSETSAS
jgi:hypothetical protein